VGVSFHSIEGEQTEIDAAFTNRPKHRAALDTRAVYGLRT
jgi:hypothetical protein